MTATNSSAKPHGSAKYHGARDGQVPADVAACLLWVMEVGYQQFAGFLVPVALEFAHGHRFHLAPLAAGQVDEGAIDANEQLQRRAP